MGSFHDLVDATLGMSLSRGEGMPGGQGLVVALMKKRSGDGMIALYKSQSGKTVETGWEELDPMAVIDGMPWRKFNWFPGQKNYPGFYWCATEQAIIGYESRLELAWLTMKDFDTAVQRIRSQPFHLKAKDGARRFKRTPDYLLLTDRGPDVLDVKDSLEADKPEVRELLERTRQVVEQRGWAYELQCEPDPTTYANIQFLAGYRRDWLFDEQVLAEILAAARDGASQSLEEILRKVQLPRAVAKSGLMHLLWTQALRVDLSQRLSLRALVEVA